MILIFFPDCKTVKIIHVYNKKKLKEDTTFQKLFRLVIVFDVQFQIFYC